MFRIGIALATTAVLATGSAGAGGLTISGTARVGQTITVSNSSGLSCYVEATHGPIEGYLDPWQVLDLFQPEPSFVLEEHHLGLKLRVRVPLLDENGIPTGSSYVSNEIGPVLHAVDPATESGAAVVNNASELAAAVGNGSVSIIVLAAGTTWAAADFPATIANKRITTPQDNPARVVNSLLRPTGWTNVRWEGMVHYNSRDWLLASAANRDFCFEPNRGSGTSNNLEIVAVKTYTDNLTVEEVTGVPLTLLQSPYRTTDPAKVVPNPPGPAYEANGTDGMRFVLQGINIGSVQTASINGYFARNMQRVLAKRASHTIRNVRAHLFYFDGILPSQNTAGVSGTMDGLVLTGHLSIYDEIDAKTNAFGSGDGPHTDGIQAQGGGDGTGYVIDRYVLMVGRTRAWADGMGSRSGSPVMPGLITSVPLTAPRLRRCLWSGSGSIQLYMLGSDYQVDYSTIIPYYTSGGGNARFNGGPSPTYDGEGRVSRSLLAGSITTQDTGGSFFQRTRLTSANIFGSLGTFVRGGNISYNPRDPAELALLCRPQPGYEDRGALTATGHWRPLGAPPSPPTIASLTPIATGFTVTLNAVSGATAYRIRFRPTGNPNGSWNVTAEGSTDLTYSHADLGGGTEIEVQTWVETADGVSRWSESSTVTTGAGFTAEFPAGGDIANIVSYTWSQGALAPDGAPFTGITIPDGALAIVIVSRGTANAITPAGADAGIWQTVATGLNASTQQQKVFSYFNKSGSAESRSFAFTAAANRSAVATMLVIPRTTAGSTLVVSASTAVASGAASMNAPSFNTGVPGKKLWLSSGGWNSGSAVTYSSGPTDYTLIRDIPQAWAANTVSALVVAGRMLEAQTEDPAAINMSNSVTAVTFTLAVREVA